MIGLGSTAAKPIEFVEFRSIVFVEGSDSSGSAAPASLARTRSSEQELQTTTHPPAASTLHFLVAILGKSSHPSSLIMVVTYTIAGRQIGSHVVRPLPKSQT